MGEKFSIYAGEPMALALVGFDENRSGRINTICDRYLQIVASESPTWTQAQWSCVCDALNGSWLSDEINIRLAWASISDADKLDGLGAKWGIDAQALAEQVRAFSHSQTIAMVEIVERFWNRTDLPTAEALQAAGAKIRQETDVP